MAVALLDTGPIVAILDRSDRWHEPCVESMKKLSRLVTVWPVVTEAMYLLDFSSQAQSALLEWLASDTVEIISLGKDDLPRIRDYMKKFRDLPMDFADAAIVRAAERTKIRLVFTIDRKDFSVYRLGRSGFDVLP